MQKLSYTPLEILKNPHSLVTQTAESKYWARYKAVLEKTEGNAITTINSNLNEKSSIFYASGRAVHMFDPISNEIDRSFTKFKDAVTSLCARKDGKMFAAGLDSGSIQIFDVKNKLNLRTFDNHKRRVNCIEYVDLNDLYSSGDDMIVRQYDVAAGTVIHSYPRAHSDYIKSIKHLQENHILTGAYDGKIRLFDFRVHQKWVSEFSHDAGVEAIDVFSNKLSFVSVGGNTVSVWDIRNHNQMFVGKNNKKTVTCVRVVATGQRFLTGSLDQHLKVYRSDTFDMTYNDKYQDAILALEVTANQNMLAVGLNNGHLFIKKSQKTNKEEEQQERDIEEMIPQFMKLQNKQTPVYNNAFFYRGIYKEPDAFDIKIDQIKNKTGFYDRCMKKFEYKKALLTAVVKNDAQIWSSIVEELEQRGVLERTLNSLDGEEVQVMIKYVGGRVANHKYRDIVLRVLELLWNGHGTDMKLKEEWMRVLHQVELEVENEKKMIEEIGLLETMENSLL